MAPTKTVRSKYAPQVSESKPGARPNSVKKRKGQPPRTKASETKSKRPTSTTKIKKKRVYTEAELGLPKLNAIVPIGVEKPKGKKKGKVFVDDAESMMTILAMVNADKEGQIESKMIKARHLEELREARSKEAEKREELKARKFEQTKQDFKKKRKPNKEESGIRQEKLGSGTTKKVAFT